MSDIQGLFNLSNFEEAGENDLLDMSLNGAVGEFDESTASMKKVYDLADKNCHIKKKIDALKSADISGDKAKAKSDETITKLEKEMDKNAKDAFALSDLSKNNTALGEEVYKMLKDGASSNQLKHHLKTKAIYTLHHDDNYDPSAVKNNNKPAKNREGGTYTALMKKFKESTEEELIRFIESATFDGMITDIIRESTEIEDKCPSCNPEVEFDPSTKTNQEIPVPGGDKEQPSTSVKEQEIAVPGGDKEQPSSKPAGQTIPAANKVLLDSDTYNAALDQLQKSFKEAVDVLQTFKEATIVDTDPEQEYNDYAESVMDEAFINYFQEKVENKDKVKKILELCKTLKREAKTEIKSICTGDLKHFRVGTIIVNPGNYDGAFSFGTTHAKIDKAISNKDDLYIYLVLDAVKSWKSNNEQLKSLADAYAKVLTNLHKKHPDALYDIEGKESFYSHPLLFRLKLKKEFYCDKEKED